MMEIRVSDVRTNVNVPAMPVPDNIRNAPAAPVRAEAQKVAEGVWFIGGGSHNSVAIEFSDHMAVIEAPLGEERSLAVLEAVGKLAPNKLVRYIINASPLRSLERPADLHRPGLDARDAQGQRRLLRTGDVLAGAAHLMPDRLSTFYPNFTGSRRPRRSSA